MKSKIDKKIIENHTTTAKTTAYIAVGTSTASSMLFAITKPNSDISRQLLTYQKLFFLLLINIPYPELLYSFLSALGGVNPFELLKLLNFFDIN